MGPDRAADPAGQAGRQQEDRGRASGRRWADVYPQHGLPVGAAAERPAAAQHRQRLLQALGLRRHAGADAPRALREMPGDGGSAGEPDGRHHRQPERQERRKREHSIDPAGFDAGKKIKGKKRHLLVDTQGLLMQAIVHAADIQDRDGGVLLMSSLFGLFPFLLKLYADSGYQGPKFQQGVAEVCRWVNVEIVKRSDAGTFVVLPKRWIVERTIGWLNRCRRLAKDWECLNRNGLAFLRWASIRLMLRRLCQTAL